MSKFFLPLVFLVAIAVPLQPVLAGPDGQKLYNQHCSVCHNDDGMGGIGLPLNAAKIEEFPRAYLVKTIRHGRPGRVMPAFVQLSDAQVNAIVEHVMGWRVKAQDISFDQARIQGNGDNGAQLFAQKCAACHGQDGKSEGTGTGVTLSREREFAVIPPALNNSGFLASASDAWIKHTITHGRVGTIMPSAHELDLDDTQVDDIVAYIRSFEDQYATASSDPLEPPTIVVDSPYDFTTTISNLKQSLQGLNFRYFPDRYLEMGLADDSVINKKQLSLRFCNFKQLYQMINTEPRLGVVLPCRVTVVETPDGAVKIYAMNMQVVSRLFNNVQLENDAAEMHEALLELIEEATL